ncbi:MAG TPA: polyphosphate:AMP phosphotransferase [Elusimicrobia bacterium]|nr:MAG: polyphosphate:AMP phosphotransferase [Elusimicrobia bacterium GWA2_66_18]OGR74363.1 MAG: polyphosphate:AMP phosphotransferase [Elusimicrobia bacterium GWC2_65_9]HAZ06945.1 polyphosphate:AMP phosphotransferase [Elusimicrobiota bacterium]
MFESAEVGNVVEKKAYEKRLERLRTDLLRAQHALASTKFRLLVLVGGVEGGGKTEVARLFLEWMDPRGLQVEAYGDKSEEEEERPEYWRYWRTLPASGRGAILVGTWYTRPIVQRVFKDISEGDFDMAMDRVVAFESMLAREGTVIVKIWLHLSKDEQRRRFTQLEKAPATSWRVSKRDWDFSSKYDRFRKICERALAKTGTAEAPWTVVEATDRRYRDLTTGETVLKAVQDAVARAELPEPAKAPDRTRPPQISLLTRLDLSKSLDAKEYDHKMMKQQARIARLTRRLRSQGRALIAVFEGADAAGKGGAIRRLLPAMDARNARVMSVAAPTDEERARPYLWRFWRHLPRLGHATIYDRSWYGRVLVERVEGFCPAADWKRAYAEIAAFEEELSESGVIVAKFWLQISRAEQLRRFKDRTVTPFKQYKITEEDWRNRAKWDAYQAAAVEMFERTSTPFAPWTLIEAEDKHWGRVKVLKTVADRLEEELA